MLKYGNRDFRSLQEQVYANMRNIEDIIKGQDIIADYTLQIVGQVDTAAELPDADTYEGKLGDIYVVGTESPFDGYAFVKVYENENAPSWVDLGPILVQGPQGEQGPQGIQGIQGPQGDQGVPAGFGVATASVQGGVGTPNVSITASGPNTARAFDFTFYNLKGEPGTDGEDGEDGITPHIGANGDWYVGDTDTGVHAQGPTGTGVPEIEAGDAGKALIVNAGETAAEWTELPSGLPDIEAGDAGKVLAVNSGETGAEWVSNVLKLPASAPATQQLVGINTSGEQNAISIGDGLTVVNNTISLSNAPILTVDFNNTTSISISEELYSKIYNCEYALIRVINGGYGTGVIKQFVPYEESTGQQYHVFNSATIENGTAKRELCINSDELRPTGSSGSRTLNLLKQQKDLSTVITAISLSVDGGTIASTALSPIRNGATLQAYEFYLQVPDDGIYGT